MLPSSLQKVHVRVGHNQGTISCNWAVDADHGSDLSDIIDCRLHSQSKSLENGEFDEKNESSGVKVQEAENYIDGEPKKEEEGDIEKVDEKKETESKKMKIKEGFHVL
ncbi:hypothetical protein H0E87_024574 [Populus deltoides]|uniref:Uncharacterized protein n=1 Tax=Populus deltoides TaxID=3696 RepID=A0A8T2X6Y9_POPDE|nr:hypothetical protein H0E87_024574 [Populus deltoides]